MADILLFVTINRFVVVVIAPMSDKAFGPIKSYIGSREFTSYKIVNPHYCLR